FRLSGSTIGAAGASNTRGEIRSETRSAPKTLPAKTSLMRSSGLIESARERIERQRSSRRAEISSFADGARAPEQEAQGPGASGPRQAPSFGKRREKANSRSAQTSSTGRSSANSAVSKASGSESGSKISIRRSFVAPR